jgi:PAS domain S-box-containing protein
MKNAERIERVESSLRSLVIDTASDGIISAGASGRIIQFNKAAERLFGYSASEMIGKPLTILMPDRFHAPHLASFNRFLTTQEPHAIGKTVELTGKTKGGAEFPLELSLASWKDDEEIFFTAIIRDITDRKGSEQRLRDSEERFRLLVENVKDYAILMLDVDGHIASWNSGAERLKGYRADEILGRHFSVFYTPEAIGAGHPQAELERAKNEGRYEEEGWRVRKDGTKFWANVVITALRDPEGQLRGFGKVTRDFTERKNAEEIVLQRAAEVAAANKELEAFSYSVSHDLRAPLRAIDGFSKILLETHSAALDQQGRHYLQRVRASTQRMGELIDGLLSLSRVGRSELRFRTVDWSGLAVAIADELKRSTPQRRVEFVIHPGMKATGDASLLHVVLENLMRNAWKFTSRHPHARIEVGMTTKGGAPIYFVGDNGAGFDMAYAEKLFGAFQRLHDSEEFEGTGIGLAIVDRIIQRHGGRIWAEGEVQKGAVFYFTVGF